MPGWIALWRDIRQHWIWEDPKRFQRWVDLLLMAQWEPTTINFSKTDVTLDRGQIATSMRILAHLWHTNSSTVIAFLDDLETHKMIKRKSTKLMTQITIVNWDKYQGDVIARKQTRERKREQIKKEEEYKNKKNNNPPTRTREDDEKVFNEMKVSQIFIEESCRYLNCSAKEFEELLDNFIIKAKLDDVHKDDNDCKSHFWNWATNKLKYRNNGNKKNCAQPADNRGAAPSDFNEEGDSYDF